jgi:hypothetical protein
VQIDHPPREERLMKKKITVSQFADELVQRIDAAKDIDCCKEELVNLANLAKDKMGNELIEVNWKDN